MKKHPLIEYLVEISLILSVISLGIAIWHTVLLHKLTEGIETRDLASEWVTNAIPECK